MDKSKWPLEQYGMIVVNDIVTEKAMPSGYYKPDDVAALERFAEDLVREVVARWELDTEMSRENLHAYNVAQAKTRDNPLFAAVREVVEKEKANG